MKKIVLKVVKQCVGTEGVEPEYIRTEVGASLTASHSQRLPGAGTGGNGGADLWPLQCGLLLPRTAEQSLLQAPPRAYPVPLPTDAA